MSPNNYTRNMFSLSEEVAKMRAEVARLRELNAALLEVCKNELLTSGCSDDTCDKYGDGCIDCCFDEMRRAVSKAEEKSEATK